VAFVRAGYADGYPQMPAGQGSVMLGNRACAILGRVTMELMAIDVTSLTVPPPIDFPVTLWGHAQLRVDDVARLAKVDTHELLCRVRGTWTWSDAPTGVNVRDFNNHRDG
jgi:alanine racemase